jgi:hypothetical protein
VSLRRRSRFSAGCPIETDTRAMGRVVDCWGAPSSPSAVRAACTTRARSPLSRGLARHGHTPRGHPVEDGGLETMPCSATRSSATKRSNRPRASRDWPSPPCSDVVVSQRTQGHTCRNISLRTRRPRCALCSADCP